MAQPAGEWHLPALLDFSGKKVFITGAGRGIGRGIGEVFARAGADVALNARTPTYVMDAASGIAERSGRTVVPVVGDLTSPAGVAAAVADVVGVLGGIDILVNALGDAIRSPLATASDADIELALDLNIRSAILCCRAVGPLLLAQGAGKVVNISSAVAARGAVGMGVYVAAKAGIEGLTRALALEWAPTVQVNAVAPGIFPDPISHAGTSREQLEARAQQIPCKRVGDPREVGFLALYLASAAADYVTGQTIYIDGGSTL